jgi:hypothetical protein
MIVVEVGITLLLVALAFYAWWAIRPSKTRTDNRSRNEGGNAFAPDGDGGGDGGGD